MTEDLEEFYKTRKGKKILKANLKELHKDFKEKKGWFSPEEDEYWSKLRNEI